MALNIVDIPDVESSDFNLAVKERLVNAHPVKIPMFTYQYLMELDAGLFAGYLARCSNGDAGDECLVYCDGFNWKVISLGSNISLS